MNKILSCTNNDSKASIINFKINIKNEKEIIKKIKMIIPRSTKAEKEDISPGEQDNKGIA